MQTQSSSCTMNRAWTSNAGPARAAPSRRGVSSRTTFLLKPQNDPHGPTCLQSRANPCPQVMFWRAGVRFAPRWRSRVRWPCPVFLREVRMPFFVKPAMARAGPPGEPHTRIDVPRVYLKLRDELRGFVHPADIQEVLCEATEDAKLRKRQSTRITQCLYPLVRDGWVFVENEAAKKRRYRAATAEELRSRGREPTGAHLRHFQSLHVRAGSQRRAVCSPVVTFSTCSHAVAPCSTCIRIFNMFVPA